LSDEPLGRLVVATGPRQGETLEVGARPRRLGSSPRCDLVLENEDGSIAPEEARVWVSEGRLTYHKLTRLTTFASDGPVGGWFILQHGDEIQVGPYRLVFELLAPDESDDSVVEALAALEHAEKQRPSRRKRGRATSSAATDVQSEDGRKPEMLVDPTLTEDIKPKVTEDTDLRLTEDVDAGAEGE